MQTMPAHLIVTRPAETGAAFADKVLAACGYDVPVLLSPGLSVVPIEASVPKNVDHVIFTSMNGVVQAKRLCVPTTAKAWCVGSRTAQAASALGFETEVAGGDASHLLQTMLEAYPKGQIVHIAGRHTRGDIARTLRNAGMMCAEITAYDQKIIAPTPDLVHVWSGDKPVVIPLFSARSGLMLSQIEWRAPVHVIAISRHVADIVVDWGADTVRTADRPDELAMISATCQVLDHLKDGVPVA